MSEMMELSIFKPQRISDWLHIYRLYRQAFPRYERKPFGMICNMYKQGKTDVWCCAERGKFCGFGATINSEDIILLDYFAVAQSKRGIGLGSAMLGRFMDMYAGKGFFVEIESTFVSAENHAERLKRKSFYRSNGLEEMGTEAYLFGTRMELLGINCRLDYFAYRDFYRDNYSQWAADNVKAVE